MVSLEHLVADARAAYLAKLVQPEMAVGVLGNPRLQPADDGVPAQAEPHISVGLPGAKLAPLHTREWAFISRLRKRLGVAPNSQPVTKPDDFWAIRARGSSGH